MNYSEQQIKEKLVDVNYQDKLTGKRIYPFADVLKEFNLGDIQDYIGQICDVKLKLADISYPTKQMFRLYIDKNQIVKVDMNAIGVMFVMAEIAKTTTDPKKKKMAYEISKAIFGAAKIFYPEERVVLRKQYTFVTKALRSRIKELSGNLTLKSDLTKLYSTIINDYYKVNDSYYLRMQKTNKTNGNYLDHITVTELQDLIDIQKQVIDYIKDYPTGSPIYFANKLANEKRLSFITRHAGVSPYDYCAHVLTPTKAYNEFNKLLKEYNLDAISLQKDEDNLQK